MQENLKHTLPSDILELLQDSSIDLRIGYQAQQLEWLSLQRSFEATFPPETEDRPATFSFLPVRRASQLAAAIFALPACLAVSSALVISLFAKDPNTHCRS